MTRQPPNPVQKLVRGVIRDLIHQANSEKADKSKKPKIRWKQSNTTNWINKNMAYVHEIKFYISSESGKLKVALYDKPAIFCNEFWIKNVDASEMGFICIPDGLKLEQKYKVEVLGIKPFHASKPEFDFIDKCAEAAFYAAKQAAMQAVIPNPGLLPPL